MAREADATSILVADIERGGVFASVIGTLSLMQPEDRDRVRWIVINKFGGDISLFEDGLRMLEERAGKRVLGVLPVYPQMRLPEEDSLALQERPETAFSAGRLKIAVVALPHMANFTDFLDLEREPGVSLRYLRTPTQLANADVVIIPGTKTTLGDLKWLEAEAWFSALQRFPGEVIGICGGFQMLGSRISDPDGHDGVAGSLDGLGLLPAETTMICDKTLRRTKLQSLLPGLDVGADVYEIHAGETQVSAGTPAFTADGRAEGCSVQNGRVWGTYAHGLFTSTEFLRAWLLSRYRSANIDAEPLWNTASDRFDEWADFLEAHLRLDWLVQ
jgi:adenosylcobyric acid synthase